MKSLGLLILFLLTPFFGFSQLKKNLAPNPVMVEVEGPIVVWIDKPTNLYASPKYQSKTKVTLTKGMYFEYIEDANEYYFKVKYKNSIKYIKRRNSHLTKIKKVYLIPLSPPDIPLERSDSTFRTGHGVPPTFGRKKIDWL